jgi:large subunit ribosomal protein L34e
MVKPMLRTRARKKVQVKTPGGRNVRHTKEGKPSKKTCGRCGINLGGVPSEVSSVMRNMAKSEKVPSRPYAGVLCSACVERLVIYTTRLEVKNKYPEYAEMELQRDLTIEKYLPADWYNSVSKK